MVVPGNNMENNDQIEVVNERVYQAYRCKRCFAIYCSFNKYEEHYLSTHASSTIRDIGSTKSSRIPDSSSDLASSSLPSSESVLSIKCEPGSASSSYLSPNLSSQSDVQATSGYDESNFNSWTSSRIESQLGIIEERVDSIDQRNPQMTPSLISDEALLSPNSSSSKSSIESTSEEKNVNIWTRMRSKSRQIDRSENQAGGEKNVNCDQWSSPAHSSLSPNIDMQRIVNPEEWPSLEGSAELFPSNEDGIIYTEDGESCALFQEVKQEASNENDLSFFRHKNLPYKHIVTLSDSDSEDESTPANKTIASRLQIKAKISSKRGRRSLKHSEMRTAMNKEPGMDGENLGMGNEQEQTPNSINVGLGLLQGRSRNLSQTSYQSEVSTISAESTSSGSTETNFNGENSSSSLVKFKISSTNPYLKTYKCKYCEKLFSRDRTRLAHMKGMHRDSFEREKKAVNKLTKRKICDKEVSANDDGLNKKRDLPLIANTDRKRRKGNDTETAPSNQLEVKTNAVNQSGLLNVTRDVDVLLLSYSCKWCDTKFSSIPPLQRHVLTEHMPSGIISK